MEIEDILLWVSRVSVFFFVGILVWCVGTLIAKARKEKKWEESYVPTLERDMDAKNIGSWETREAMERQERDRVGGKRSNGNR